MLKKIIVVAIFVLVVVVLGSCRTKKSSCVYSKLDTIEQTQNDVACID